MAVKPLLRATLQLLESSGIPYCLLHGWERLEPDSPADVDLAIRPQDLERVEELLGGRQTPSCVQLLQHESTGYYFVLAASGGEAPAFLRLDFATDYRRDGRLLLSSAQLLSGRRLEDGIWVSSPAVEFSYLLLKKVLKGSAPPSQLQRLKLLAAKLGSEADGLAAGFFGRGFALRILSWLGKEDWSALERNLPVLKKHLRRATLQRDPSAWLRYWLPELRRSWRRWLHPAGLFVAVLGADGSGKSSLIRRLPVALGLAFRRSDAFHWRPRLLPASDCGPADNPQAKAPRAPFASFLKLLYLVLDYNLGYLLRVRPRLVRSSLVLFDRYFQDMLADPVRYRHKGPRWLLRLAGALVPRPDLLLVLDVPLVQLRERKQEVPLAEAERQRAAYRELAMELPNAVLLAGGRSEAEVTVEAAGAILSYLRWRYSRRRLLWFPSSRGAGWNWVREILYCGTGRPSADRGLWRLSLDDGRGYAFPVAPPRTAAAALGLYGGQSLRARAAKRALAAGLATGLVQPFLPRLGGRPGAEGSDGSLPDHLKEILRRRDLSFAVSLGTPGAHRKPVIQVLEQGGRALAFAKVGWNAATIELVSNEAAVLRRMAELDLPGLSLPTLLYLDHWQGRLLCLQSPAPPGAVRAGWELNPGFIRALHALAAIEPRPLRLEESPFWASLGERASLLEGGWPGSALRAFLELVPRELREQKLLFGSCHGDFVPWNSLCHDGRLFLFDWEYSARHWLPGYDVFHFLIQRRLLLGREPPLRLLREVLGGVTGAGELEGYWRRLEVPQRILGSLLLLYLLERALRVVSETPQHHPAQQRLLALLQLCSSELGWLP